MIEHRNQVGYSNL